MRQLGAPAEVLARLDESGPQDIEVLQCNWNTVTVWTYCIPAYAGMGQRVGVPAAEVRAALLLMRVPRAEWPDVLAGVRVMDRACG